jgi:sigma-70-like protein
MGHLEKRNSDILYARKSGATYTEIGARFGLSRSRVQQIYSRHLRAEEARRQAMELREVFKSSSLNKEWPTKLLLEGLAFPWRSTRALKKYFYKNNILELSLKDLIDFTLPENKPWTSSQAFKQRGTGRKTYKELVNHLSKQDLGNLFNTEWEKRRFLGYVLEVLRNLGSKESWSV